MQVQHRAPFFILTRWRLFLVGIQQQVEECPVHATRSLHDPRNIPLLGFWVRIAQILPAIFTMPREIPILPPVDTLPFLPSQDAPVLNIKCLFCVVRQFILRVLAKSQPILVIDDTLIPLEAILFPVVKPLQHLAWMHEELQIPLLELALAEQEVPRRNLVAESLPDLADTERNLQTRGLQHIIIVQVDVLARLTAQVGLHPLTLNNPKVRLHHQIEGAWLCEFPAAYRAFILC